MEKCKHEASRLEVEKLGNVSQGNDVEIYFKEYCINCNELLGREVQRFKYVGREGLEMK